MDQSAVQVASCDQKTRSLEAEVERLRPRKKRKVRLDPNTRFARIGDIIRAKKELGKQLEPTDSGNSFIFEDMCIEWSIFDPSEDTVFEGAGGEN